MANVADYLGSLRCTGCSYQQPDKSYLNISSDAFTTPHYDLGFYSGNRLTSQNINYDYTTAKMCSFVTMATLLISSQATIIKMLF